METPLNRNSLRIEARKHIYIYISDVCLEATFSGDPHTQTCYASRWAGLYLLWLFILEDIFKRTVRLGFVEIFRCHCHLQ